MSKNVKSADAAVVSICTYRWVDPDGHIDTCRSHAKCPICKQCSRVVDDKEQGHCPGHLGLRYDIMETLPGRGTI